MTSQMPSHARIINSSPSCSWNSLISGNAVTACCFSSSSLFILYSKSPNARDSANEPLTRPSLTKPPAFMMRLRSPSFIGLWSSLISTASPPFRENTARESPALAQYTLSPRTHTTTEVAPACGPVQFSCEASSAPSPPLELAISLKSPSSNSKSNLISFSSMSGLDSLTCSINAARSLALISARRFFCSSALAPSPSNPPNPLESSFSPPALNAFNSPAASFASIFRSSARKLSSNPLATSPAT
mmetsp:Transcript_1601/g.6402  ORF Transcript_1601/g.6402 Transcript_1601/m.6402 type:complete len:245 (+) Transcript_1601:287-1021(+)